MPQSALSSTNIGFFGKLPTNGDFIHRNLSTNFVTRWDHWLQNSLSYYQDLDPSHWLNNYLTSPIWRFFIPPSLFDDQAYIGILAPSVDNVGRYFPLTFAANLPAQQASVALSEPYQGILGLLENSFLTHLHANNATLENVEHDITIINEQLARLIAQQSIEPLPEALESHQFILSNRASIAESASCIWLNTIMQRQANISLWWTEGSQTIQPSLLFARGLPSNQQFSSMLSSFENSSEWRSKQMVAPSMDEGELERVSSLLTQISPPAQPAPVQTESDSVSALAYPPTETESYDAISGQDILSNFQSPNFTSTQDSTMPSNSSTDASNINIRTYGFSDVGNKRTQNQDAILVSDNNALWLVADGMGGHYDGDKASQDIVKQLSEMPLSNSLFEKVGQIKQAIEQVNSEIFNYAQENRLTCGSTVVLITLEQDKGSFLWAGDSRLYMWRNDNLTQLSTDHSMINLYKESGLPTDNIKNNAITRAVGVDDQIELDVGHITMLPGDRLMLSSDGLHDPAGDACIKHALSLSSPEEAATYLKELVLSGEAKDNLSGVFIWL